MWFHLGKEERRGEGSKTPLFIYTGTAQKDRTRRPEGILILRSALTVN